MPNVDNKNGRRIVARLFADGEQDTVGNSARTPTIDKLTHLLPEPAAFLNQRMAARHDGDQGQGFVETRFPFFRNVVACDFGKAHLGEVDVTQSAFGNTQGLGRDWLF